MDVTASTAGDDVTPADEGRKPSISAGKAASQETALLELPKVTQAMVNALLVECRTHHPNNRAAANAEPRQTQMETEQGERTAEETTGPNNTEEGGKMQEREKKEREARKEKEVRERERKDRERRALEKEERARREKEERARREKEDRARWERKDKERRDRKRAHREGARSYGRSGGYKQSSWKEEPKNRTEEEECDDFPFNMSDFVTLDEVGDVADLPSTPPAAAPTSVLQAAPTSVLQAAPTSVLQDTPEDTPMEVTTEAMMSETPGPRPEEHASECEAVTMVTAETSDGVVSSESADSQTHVPTCQQADVTPHTGATLDSSAEGEALPAAESSTREPATGTMTSERERGKKEDTVKDEEGHTEKEEKIKDQTEKTKEHDELKGEEDNAEKKDEEQETAEEQEKMEDEETGAPAVETGKHKMSEVENTAEASVKKKTKMDTAMSTGSSLPPFDPTSPVGMEFLTPKTGFFCKVCNRFFNGTKEAEINHCKTLKHYESLQKHLQAADTASLNT
ncbi:hypothetical protein CgunFtcFv8_022719 [Champsocephalus gunnari]|uniref:Matrin-type domain-containing protein n=1 Tax=Champsocephalus gunnari TaxID=52237 RepID=A0AAN8DQ60_CHAGU|nr:hypothetical protein CgunFtcFv8_022719 [Champsocephalus gunnari]